MFRNYFVTNKLIHDHFTRHNEDIHILRCNTNVRAFCIKIYGANIWNSVPLNIKSAPSFNNFKQKFRSYLIDLYNYDARCLSLGSPPYFCCSIFVTWKLYIYIYIYIYVCITTFNVFYVFIVCYCFKYGS